MVTFFQGEFLIHVITCIIYAASPATLSTDLAVYNIRPSSLSTDVSVVTLRFLPWDLSDPGYSWMVTIISPVKADSHVSIALTENN